jgi:DNA-binding CsgD family transcriptional regulator
LIDSLTDRERQVLRLLADGHTQAAIARRFDVTERHVHRYCSRVRTKLGACSIAHAVAIAYQTGVLGPVADMLQQLQAAGYRLAIVPIQGAKGLA